MYRHVTPFDWSTSPYSQIQRHIVIWDELVWWRLLGIIRYCNIPYTSIYPHDMPVMFPIHPLAIYRCSFPVRNCHPWGLNTLVLSVSNSFPAVLVGLESPQLFIESQISLVNHAKPNIWYLNSTFFWFKPTVLLLNFPSSRPLAVILRPPELREAAWSWDELRLVILQPWSMNFDDLPEKTNIAIENGHL